MIDFKHNKYININLPIFIAFKYTIKTILFPEHMIQMSQNHRIYQHSAINLSTEFFEIRIFLSLNFTPLSLPSQNQR